MEERDSIEQNLIYLLKGGSIDAFDKIYQMYSKRLYSYSIQYTKSSEDAEEIVQDVFVQLWQNREKIRQSDTLQALLFIIAKHHLINAYRSSESTVYTLEIDLEANKNELKPGKQYYFIIGALINASEAKLNYAAPIRITI